MLGAEIVGDIHKPNQIEQALNGLGKEVLLARAGTGLDQTTATVNSEQGVI